MHWPQQNIQNPQQPPGSVNSITHHQQVPLLQLVQYSTTCYFSMCIEFVATKSQVPEPRCSAFQVFSLLLSSDSETFSTLPPTFSVR